MSMLLLGAGTGTGQTFSAAVAGQTLITREPFDTDLSSGTPGNFSGGVSGTIAGGMTCGPNWATHINRRSGGLRYPETSERTSSSTFFKGQFLVDNATLAQSIMMGGWFRFGSGENMSTLRDLMSYYIGYAPIGIGARWASTNPTKITLGLGYSTFTEFGGPVEINCHQWYWLAVGVTWSGTTVRIKCGYMANGGTTLTEFGDSSDRTETFNSATYRFYLNHSVVANQGSLACRVGGLSLYQVTTMPVALTYPTEIAHPTEEQTVYTLDQVNGNDNNRNGPWLTDTGVENARKAALFKGAYIPWKTAAGADASFSSLANVAAKQAWGTAYEADRTSRVPQGDILEIASGDHFLQVGLNFEQTCPGITIRAANPADPPTLYMDQPLGNVTWTHEGLSVYSGVAEIGVVRAGLWQKTTPDANGRLQRLPLYAIRTTNAATAETLLGTYSGSYWTNEGPSNVWVHAWGEGEPSGSDYFYTCIALTHVHAIILGDGLVQDIQVAGGLQYTTDGSDQLFARYHFAVMGNTTYGQISVFERCVSKEYGKHGFAFVSNNPTHLAIRVDCETRSGPINTPETNVGFGTGAWSAYVDFSGAPNQAANGTGVVCLNYGLIDIDNRAVVGSLTPEQSVATSAYLSHNNGGLNQFAFVGVYDQVFGNPATNWFTAAGPWQDAYPHW